MNCSYPAKSLILQGKPVSSNLPVHFSISVFLAKPVFLTTRHACGCHWFKMATAARDRDN
jgi:hypothetical protein